jgi:hypothetical protein
LTKKMVSVKGLPALGGIRAGSGVQKASKTWIPAFAGMTKRAVLALSE